MFSEIVCHVHDEAIDDDETVCRVRRRVGVCLLDGPFCATPGFVRVGRFFAECFLFHVVLGFIDVLCTRTAKGCH